MKAAVYGGNGDVQVKEVNMPIAGPGEVVFRVKACGVCGTDVHIYNGEPGSAECAPGTIIGHEAAGIVHQVGEGVAHLKSGDPVVLDPNEACGCCSNCLSAKAHYCTGKKCYGTTYNGAFAEYMKVGAKALHKVSGSLTFEEYAMAEPLSCCIHGMDLCDIQSGSTAVIFGAGGIGLMMLQLAKLQGAARIAVIEPSEEKRKLALKLGATAGIDPREPDLQKALESAGCEAPDTVIECAGRRECIEQALAIAGPCAVVMLFGLTAPDVEIPMKPRVMFEKEITVKASFINPYTTGRAIHLLESGAVNVKDLIISTVPLDQVAQVLSDDILRGRGKVVVTI